MSAAELETLRDWLRWATTRFGEAKLVFGHGTTNAYGTTVPCEQTLPMTQPGDATVHLPGLETETVYHYRFRATNGNGTSNGPDRTFTPHWVAGLDRI